MQQALDSNTLDRLIALGRQQGQLTTLDLETNLPIHSMSAEDIALIVVHLEEAGIPVELEDSLMVPQPKPPAAPTRSAEIISFPDRAAASRMRKQTAPLQNAASVQAQSAFVQQEKRAAHWAVALGGLLVLALMAGALVLFGV
ncbi:RNA polymerase sigma factor region1.1 domain-containing protein [Microvirga terrestris]|uniref:RNA polymerase sigma factor region1.1 domain-containing protein n=1 Tax=Microvirga terrestris TaxID=2791024 RepID=A0ABS0HWF9_9HYPH|nr:RNA polymerase sigma factor region1.1 domain-containing protein [Microvirga terrestris]MBF9197800.1 RNA polymerase sigma factor region1.1 domain-containing protein [Microvirga terrestris]